MIELILGGARSGKSHYAERRGIDFKGEVIYLATAFSGDKEMAARIKRHQADRPSHWLTIEEPVKLAATLLENDGVGQLFLVDCLTLWLSNVLFSDSDVANEQRFKQEKSALLEALPALKADVLFVSNEVGQGIIPLNAISRRFVDEAGWLHQAIARECDRVTLVTAGLPQKLKG